MPKAEDKIQKMEYIFPTNLPFPPFYCDVFPGFSGFKRFATGTRDKAL